MVQIASVPWVSSGHPRSLPVTHSGGRHTLGHGPGTDGRGNLLWVSSGLGTCGSQAWTRRWPFQACLDKCWLFPIAIWLWSGASHFHRLRGLVRLGAGEERFGFIILLGFLLKYDITCWRKNIQFQFPQIPPGQGDGPGQRLRGSFECYTGWRLLRLPQGLKEGPFWLKYLKPFFLESYLLLLLALLSHVVRHLLHNFKALHVWKYFWFTLTPKFG